MAINSVIRTLVLVSLLWCMGCCLPAAATTKGLNQIVTPDIQPQGILSISFQAQQPTIGNRNELQFEYGITPNFEVAVFQGFVPGETVLHAEWGLIQRKDFLLSTGVLGIEQGRKPQPFLEGGYYRDKLFGIAGIQRQDTGSVGVFGFGYQATPTTLLTLDYMTGADNFATAGVTYALTPNLSFNPALYYANRAPHRCYGYGVLTWNLKLR